MKTLPVAFIINDLTDFRLCGVIIDEALRQGRNVECWLNSMNRRGGAKSYLTAEASKAPKFRNGAPRFKCFKDIGELRKWLLERAAAAVISTSSLAYTLNPSFIPGLTAVTPPPKEKIPPWIMLQYHGQNLCAYGPADVLSSHYIAIYSDFWIKWSSGHFIKLGETPADGEYERRLRKIATPVGYPDLEEKAIIDAKEVRARWHIKEGKPVVVLLPYPGAIGARSFWSKHLFPVRGRIHQLRNIVRARRFEYLPDVIMGWSEENAYKAIRKFCDRNNAHLLVKSRQKTPIPADLQAIADTCMYDLSYYPATIREALAIADLCISFYSSAALEAVGMGAPHLSLTFSPKDFADDKSMRINFDEYQNSREGGFFQFDGVAATMTIPEAIRKLPKMPLESFKMNQASRIAYVNKFLGGDDGLASQKFWNFIDKIMERESASLT